MKIMLMLGAKPNGTPHTFNVGPDFIRTAALAVSTAVSVAFAAGTYASKARSVGSMDISTWDNAVTRTDRANIHMICIGAQ